MRIIVSELLKANFFGLVDLYFMSKFNLILLVQNKGSGKYKIVAVEDKE